MRVSVYATICLLVSIQQIIGASDLGIPFMTHILHDPQGAATLSTSKPEDNFLDMQIFQGTRPISDTLQLRHYFLYVTQDQFTMHAVGRPIPPLLTGKKNYAVVCTTRPVTCCNGRKSDEYSKRLPVMRYFLLHADRYYDAEKKEWQSSDVQYDPQHLVNIQQCATLVHAKKYLKAAQVPYPLVVVDLAAWLICCDGPEWRTKFNEMNVFVAQIPHEPLLLPEWHPYIAKEQL